MRHPRTYWLLPFVLLACSRGIDSAELGLRYEPPAGMSHLQTRAGPPAEAEFEGGLRILKLPGTTTPLASVSPEALLAELQQAGVLEARAQLRSARGGSIAAGPVIRYELDSGPSRMLVYVLQAPGGHLLFTLTGRGGTFDTLSNRFERSLGSVRLR